MLTAGQCRTARAFLKWKLPELAQVLMVSISTINAFEFEHLQPICANLAAVQRAFAGAGIEFIGPYGVCFGANTAQKPPST